MALNFDYKNVADWEAASTHPCYPDVWNPIGNALVWMSLTCGYNTITEKNATQIAQRLMEYQMVKGPLLDYTTRSDGAGVTRKLYIDEPEVRRYIGLRTNASSLTDREWNKKLLDIISTAVGDARYGRKTTALEQFDKDCKELNTRKEN